jgi:hypothetical protein
MINKALTTIILTLSLNAQSIYMSVERYPDSELNDFVTHCKTKVECYKKFQWAVTTGKYVDCKRVTMLDNDVIIWSIDFEKNDVWSNRQQQRLWSDDD